jgi:hypothetical protein
MGEKIAAIAHQSDRLRGFFIPRGKRLQLRR